MLNSQWILNNIVHSKVKSRALAIIKMEKSILFYLDKNSASFYATIKWKRPNFPPENAAEGNKYILTAYCIWEVKKLIFRLQCTSPIKIWAVIIVETEK